TDHFVDAGDSIFEDDINANAEVGITQGCNPPDNDQFCPDDHVTRGQMAAFLRRAFEYPASGIDHFTDDDGSVFEGDINAIAEVGVTKGCNPPENTRYCPDDLVLRDQMASFLGRALDLEPVVLGTTTTTTAPGDTTTTTQPGGTTTTSTIPGGCPEPPILPPVVGLPYTLDFESDHNGICDKNDVGTGFTWVDEPTNGTGLLPANLELTGGALNITTTAGLMSEGDNSQDNALAVGVASEFDVLLISATMVDPPAGTNNFEQGGLWYGIDEDNYVKLVVIDRSNGQLSVQLIAEVNGIQGSPKNSADLGDLSSSTVELTMRTDPGARTVEGRYSVDGGSEVSLGSLELGGEFFNADQAGIDPEIGTRTFTGVFASHRNGPAPLVYAFDELSVVAESGGSGGGTASGGISFTEVQNLVDIQTTSMVWGPDDRLYVTGVLGDIRAYTFDANWKVTGVQEITSLRDAYGGGLRLLLGLTVDPASTASNVILWAAHSEGFALNFGDPGEANSGTVTKLSGTDFVTVTHVITGLPRAMANHATNSIHFGPDGRLFIAQGGNTGAGAPGEDPDSTAEFGTRPEQPLSAALLVADVKASGFEGDCASEPVGDDDGISTKTIPATCDVQIFATGLRNMYDFTFHSNGNVYGPDNGKGVQAPVPEETAPDCRGITPDEDKYEPAEQPDRLHLIEEGNYYGHPNPSRDQCVFFDGTDPYNPDVDPLPNFTVEIHKIGNSFSANGTIEYTFGDAFCGQLQGDLLIANFSGGGGNGRSITRYVLNSAGTDVVEATHIVTGLDDPLPLAMGPDGVVFVGEFSNNTEGGPVPYVTVLVPDETGCWEPKADMPQAILDATGAVAGGQLYTVGGKTSSGHVDNLYAYNPATNTWDTTLPDLPAGALEDVAAVGYDGEVYVFGGATGPFSGATTQAHSFDPGTEQWTALPNMPTARAGATAEVFDDKIYLIGGMDPEGASLDTVDVYTPATNTWSSGPAMQVRRDNPGSAVLDGHLYVFGGRTRNADGSSPEPNLTSVERLTTPGGPWELRADLPTGRRSMVVGVIGGRAQVIGGEDPTTDVNEEYDPATDTWRSLISMPTGRHGAAGGTISGVVYVVAGGPSDGSSFTKVHEAFSFE
ncbi:MAG: Kelch repeat-containing protein, partial [Acidimicrobiia bacterium]